MRLPVVRRVAGLMLVLTILRIEKDQVSHFLKDSMQAEEQAVINTTSLHELTGKSLYLMVLTVPVSFMVSRGKKMMNNKVVNSGRMLIKKECRKTGIAGSGSFTTDIFLPKHEPDSV